MLRMLRMLPWTRYGGECGLTIKELALLQTKIGQMEEEAEKLKSIQEKTRELTGAPSKIQQMMLMNPFISG